MTEFNTAATGQERQPRVIVSDIIGTLYDLRGKVRKKYFEALVRLKIRGETVLFVSSRPKDLHKIKFEEKIQQMIEEASEENKGALEALNLDSFLDVKSKNKLSEILGDQDVDICFDDDEDLDYCNPQIHILSVALEEFIDPLSAFSCLLYTSDAADE